MADSDEPSPESHPREPLHGITLKTILTKVVERHGWEEMDDRSQAQ